MEGIEVCLDLGLARGEIVVFRTIVCLVSCWLHKIVCYIDVCTMEIYYT